MEWTKKQEAEYIQWFGDESERAAFSAQPGSLLDKIWNGVFKKPLVCQGDHESDAMPCEECRDITIIKTI